MQFKKVSSFVINVGQLQLTLFFYALSYFTRIPITQRIVFDPHQFHKANAYLPIIGLLVASVMIIVFYLCQLLFSIQISLILMLASSILLTGALHEDGFADCCDGFGGGYDTEQRLKIMKDSQIGSYAGIGLVILLLLKFNLLLALAEINVGTLFVSLIIAHTASRYGALSVMQILPYVRLEKDGKVQSLSKKLNDKYFVFASFCVFLVLCLLPLSSAIIVAGLSFAVGLLLCRWFKKSLAGYTGDCLGFSQQCLEITILLMFSVLFQ